MSAEFFILFTAPLSILIPIGLIYSSEQGHKKYTKRAVIFTLLWLIITYILADRGWLHDFSSMPPKFIFIFPVMVVFSILIVRSEIGDLIIKKNSVYTLIGLQGFRLLPEYFLSLAYYEALAPIQMTWHGRNWDVITAIVAILLFLGGRYIFISARIVGYMFSILGMGLLLNIFVIAMLSMPTPFRYFMSNPANTFITDAPYIWLPTVWVFVAIFLHFLLLKKLYHLKI